MVYWLVLLAVPVLLIAFYASLAKAYLAHEKTMLKSDIGSALADSN